MTYTSIFAPGLFRDHRILVTGGGSGIGRCISMRHHGGVIVNITAREAGGMPLMGHSGAARAGVHNLTATAAVEWAADGGRSTTDAPEEPDR